MDHCTLLEFMALAEKLKCNTRHSWTSSGRRESVAEHTYRLCVFSWLVKEEFPECDMDKILKMCLFHDIGEAVTGDIPSFEKKEADEEKESREIDKILEMLPDGHREELRVLIKELRENETMEAKVVHALDKMEAVIQHNEASLDTWLPLEYELQMIYGQEQAEVHPYLKHLRRVLREDSERKVEEAADAALDLQILGVTGEEEPEVSFGAKTGQKESGYVVRKGSEYIDKDRVAELLRATEWAKDRSKEMIGRCVDNSISYGVYDEKNYMVGYARMISDLATTFYLMDVVIDEAYRGRGLGRLLLDAMMKDVGHLHGVLHTENAQGLYEKYGFQVRKDSADTVMEKPRK